MTAAAFQHRYSDFLLGEEQQAFGDAVAKMFASAWSPDKARSAPAGPLDDELFAAISDMELLSMAVLGDDAIAGLAELVVAAEVAGAALARFPLAEVWTCVRLLSSLGVDPHNMLQSPATLPVLAFDPLDKAQLIPWGSETRTIIGRLGKDLVQIQLEAPLVGESGSSGIPFGSWSRDAAGSLLSLASADKASAAWDRALDDWRIVTAALVAGVGMTAIAEAVEFAKQRETRGVKIGSLQAISHSLADAHIDLVVARNLARKAAWFVDNERGSGSPLGTLAFIQAARAASKAAHVGVHVHGGQGVSTDSLVSLAFTRARQWPLVAGDYERLLVNVGKQLAAAAGSKELVQ